MSKTRASSWVFSYRLALFTANINILKGPKDCLEANLLKPTHLLSWLFFIYCYWKRVMFMINISNPSMKGILLRYISRVLHLWYICSVQRNNSNTPLAKRSPEVEDVQENRSKTQEPFTTQNHEMTCFFAWSMCLFPVNKELICSLRCLVGLSFL